MLTRIILVLSAGFIIGAPLGAPAGESPHDQDQATIRLGEKGETSDFAIKQTEPATLLYLEHDGPYWRLGPLVDQVAEIVSAEQIAGDLFIRYPGDPLARRAARGKIRVGVVTHGQPPALPPFKEETMDATLVAYATTTLPASMTTPLHTALRRWAAERGYGVLGPIVEIYRPSNTEAAINELVIEIQIPIRPLTAPPQPSSTDNQQVTTLRMPPLQPDQTDRLIAPEPSTADRRKADPRPDPRTTEPKITDHQKTAKIDETDTARSIRPKREKATVALQTPSPTQLEAYRDKNQTMTADIKKASPTTRERAPQSPPRETERTETRPAQRELPRQRTPRATTETSRTSPPPKTSPSDTRQQPMRPIAETTKPTTPSPSESPAPADVQTILELIDSGDFNRVASQTIPTEIVQSPEDLAWMQQVIGRIEAIAKGVKQVYPDAQTPLEPLAESLRSRFTQLPVGRNIAAPTQHVVRFGGSPEAQMNVRSNTLRELDRLMGLLAVRAVDQQQALEAVARTLENITKYLRRDK